LNVLRIEKGFITHSEITGRVTAFDIGMDRMVSLKKDCIGRAASRRAGLLEPDREQMIGLRPVHPDGVLTAGAHLFAMQARAVAAQDQGYVTSVGHSPTLGHFIGLGFLKSGPDRHGERMMLVDHLRQIRTEVEICAPVFVDPDGMRAHG
jgi:sarcosine oxidase subunit alpha